MSDFWVGLHVGEEVVGGGVFDDGVFVVGPVAYVGVFEVKVPSEGFGYEKFGNQITETFVFLLLGFLLFNLLALTLCLLFKSVILLQLNGFLKFEKFELFIQITLLLS